MRGSDKVGAFGKQLPSDTIKRALTIVGISLGIVLICTIALSISERATGVDMLDLMFEATSAFGTVGRVPRGRQPNQFSQALLIPRSCTLAA